MKEIKTGDRVKFLNDTGSGLVTGIIDGDMVLVRTDEDGFEYPVMKSELLISLSASSDIEIEELVRINDENSPHKDEVISDEKEIMKEETVYPEESLIPNREMLIDKNDILKAPVKAEKKKKRPVIEEVDLHIAQIVDNQAGMTSGEMVEIQLARFRTALDGAIKAKQDKIVFIHGRGAGKLKREIQQIIDNDYRKCRHQDASFREYGFGATMIFIS